MAIPGEKILSELSVAEIALAFPSAPDILNRYKIDYCCGGNLSFTTACEQAGLDAAQVYNDIIEVHHTYVKEAIVHLENNVLLKKVN